MSMWIMVMTMATAAFGRNRRRTRRRRSDVVAVAQVAVSTAIDDFGIYETIVLALSSELLSPAVLISQSSPTTAPPPHAVGGRHAASSVLNLHTVDFVLSTRSFGLLLPRMCWYCSYCSCYPSQHACLSLMFVQQFLFPLLD